MVFRPDQEEELWELIMDMENRMYGQNLVDVCQLLSQYCELNHITKSIRQANTDGGCGLDEEFIMLCELQEQHPYNGVEVSSFYDLPVQHVVHQWQHEPCSPHHKLFIMSMNQNGAKMWQQLFCTAATDVIIPSTLIFRRVRFLPELINKAPTVTTGRAAKSGSINPEIFNDWFDHFVRRVQPTHRAQPFLLILDGHSSVTKNLELSRKVRDESHNCLPTFSLYPQISAVRRRSVQQSE